MQLGYLWESIPEVEGPLPQSVNFAVAPLNYAALALLQIAVRWTQTSHIESGYRATWLFACYQRVSFHWSLDIVTCLQQLETLVNIWRLAGITWREFAI